MAIKGKARRRSRTRHVVAPRPHTIQKPPTLLQRVPIRRTVVLLLSLAVILGGFRIWENVSRSRALTKFASGVVNAEKPIVPYLTASSATSLDTFTRDFSTAKATAKQLIDQANTWEKDFRAAKDAVSALTPPAEAKAAKDGIVRGLDMYVGVARLYNLAAQLRQTADKQPAAGQKQVEEKVDVTLQHATEWLNRASLALNDGTNKLNELAAAWHVKAPIEAGNSVDVVTPGNPPPVPGGSAG